MKLANEDEGQLWTAAYGVAFAVVLHAVLSRSDEVSSMDMIDTVAKGAADRVLLTLREKGKEAKEPQGG